MYYEAYQYKRSAITSGKLDTNTLVIATGNRYSMHLYVFPIAGICLSLYKILPLYEGFCNCDYFCVMFCGERVFNNFTLSFLFDLLAQSTGISLLSSRALMSAPCFTNILIIPSSAYDAA